MHSYVSAEAVGATDVQTIGNDRKS